jgi:hypothetical protein
LVEILKGCQEWMTLNPEDAPHVEPRIETLRDKILDIDPTYFDDEFDDLKAEIEKTYSRILGSK